MILDWIFLIICTIVMGLLLLFIAWSAIDFWGYIKFLEDTSYNATYKDWKKFKKRR